LKYWNKVLDTRPALAKMGLSFTSAPATGADAERVFSEGRNQLSWNQHSMSPQTFRNKMSIGAWSKAPCFDVEMATSIIAKHARPLRESGEESEEGDITDTDSSSGSDNEADSSAHSLGDNTSYNSGFVAL
ncbi:hypothetical protein OF83DRAFT_1067493, partial [Amylostereum chailletii]